MGRRVDTNDVKSPHQLLRVEKHDFVIYKQEVTAILTETVLKTALKKEIC